MRSLPGLTEDRAIGHLLALAVLDAVRMALELEFRDSYDPDRHARRRAF